MDFGVFDVFFLMFDYIIFYRQLLIIIYLFKSQLKFIYIISHFLPLTFILYFKKIPKHDCLKKIKSEIPDSLTKLMSKICEPY
jgi:c-di-AMP phosphodiesterase-like protein